MMTGGRATGIDTLARMQVARLPRSSTTSEAWEKFVATQKKLRQVSEASAGNPTASTTASSMMRLSLRPRMSEIIGSRL